MAHYLPRTKAFIAAAHCPLPDSIRQERTRVKHGHGPRYRNLSYYDVESDTIWLTPTDWKSRFVFFHECGHVYDRHHLSDTDREYLRHLLGYPRRPWFWGKWNPLKHFVEPVEEKFADAYARCCMNPTRQRRLRWFLAARKRG